MEVEADIVRKGKKIIFVELLVLKKTLINTATFNSFHFADDKGSVL